METHDFVLTFRLPGDDADPQDFLDALFEAGCNDATVGVGRRGYIAFEFSRHAPSLAEARDSAIAAVQNAIPEAERVVEA